MKTTLLLALLACAFLIPFRAAADAEADFVSAFKAAIESRKDAEILPLFPAGEYPKGAGQKYHSDYTLLFREQEVLNSKVSNCRIETPKEELLFALKLPTLCDNGKWYGIVNHSNRVIMFDRTSPDGKKRTSAKLLIFGENKYWLAVPEVVPHARR